MRQKSRCQSNRTLFLEIPDSGAQISIAESVAKEAGRTTIESCTCFYESRNHYQSAKPIPSQNRGPTALAILQIPHLATIATVTMVTVPKEEAGVELFLWNLLIPAFTKVRKSR